MPITFEQIPGGATTTPVPSAIGAGTVELSGFGFGPTLAQLGAAGGGRIGLFAANDGVVATDPSYGVGYGELSLSGYGYGSGIEPAATGYGKLALFGYGYEASTFGFGVLPLRGYGFGGNLAAPPMFLDDVVSLTTGLVLGSTTSALHTALIRARLTIGANPRARWEGTRTLNDEIAFEVGLAMVYRELLQVSVALGSATTVTRTAVAQMVDALLLGGVVNGALEAIQLITEALTFGALAEAIQIGTGIDALTLGDQVRESYKAAAQLVDTLLLGDSLPGSVTLVALVRDELAIGTASATSLEAIAVLRDGLDFVLRLSIDNGEYVAWAINTESKGLSRYTQYPFNSFMRVGGKYYGASDTGVHRLEGADDAGEPIAAKLRLGMSSLGSRVMKRSPTMYAGYSASGDLLLKVITAHPETAEREAHCYRMVATAAGSVREGRVPIGQGLKSVYFDYELENINGADFEIDVLELRPLMLERRVRGNSAGKR